MQSDRDPGSNMVKEVLGNRLQLLKLLPADAKLILEFGCGQGILGEQYKRINPHSQYIGIEVLAELGKIAAQKIDRVIIGDAENLDDLTLDIPEGSVDCLVMGDLLPTFKNPLKILEYYSTLLNYQGQIIAKIPNLQHWVRIVKLLQGKWDNPEGDKQYWFTLESIQNLFKQANLQIYELQAFGHKNENFVQFQKLLEPTLQTLGTDPKNFRTQTGAEYYIVRATKSILPPRRLLIQTIIMAPTGCDRVRVLEPDQLSATIPGVRTISAVKSAEAIAPLPTEEKVFIWQRTIMQYPAHIPKLKELLQQGYLIVAEIDDNPIRRREYADNNYLSYRGCHCVQTSTELLAEFLRQHNPNVAVFTNQLAFLPPPRSYQPNEPVTLFFGALNREKDWQPIITALNRVLAAYPHQVRAKVIHDRQFFEALQIKEKEFEPFCSYEQYQEILHSCDIGLLPLEPNPINEMKSDLKFIECAGHGVCAIASPTVYATSIVEGKTGLIYHSVPEFEAKLHSLITDSQLRQQLATNAYQWVRDNRLLSQHYRQRRDWYLQMRDALPRLNQELRDRVPELFVK